MTNHKNGIKCTVVETSGTIHFTVKSSVKFMTITSSDIDTHTHTQKTGEKWEKVGESRKRDRKSHKEVPRIGNDNSIESFK